MKKLNLFLLCTMISITIASAQTVPWVRNPTPGFVYLPEGTDYVGIGTTTPQVKLHIMGSVRGDQSGALRVNTGNGYIDIGPQNPFWAHIYTDRDAFLFNKSVFTLDGALSSYGSANLRLQTHGSDRITVLNSNGNVGIGTTTPRGRLDVAGLGDIYLVDDPIGGSAKNLYLPGHVYLSPHGSSNVSYLQARRSDNSGTPSLRFRTYTNGNLTEAMHIEGNGDIGVGTSIPKAKLHVTGNVILDTTIPAIYTGAGSVELNRFLHLSNSPEASSASGLKAGGILVADEFGYASPSKNDMVVKGTVAIGEPLTSNPNNYSLLVKGKINASSLFMNDVPVISSQWNPSGTNIFYDGAVGIGTSLATNPNGYTLAVNGKIGAKDVRVEQSSATWPDYVFKTNYTLPALSQVEEFIKENSHLQGVPSASEIEKDGHSLGEMDAILLKKIEELTLYVIQQQKEIDMLKRQLQQK